MAVVADFIASNTIGPSPLFVTFWDTSTGGPDNWLWDFGDGNMSSDKNPTHTYTGENGAEYTVTLTAWVDDFVENVTLTQTGYVRDAQPILGDDCSDADTLAFADLLSTGYGSTSPVSTYLGQFGLADVIVEYREGYLITTSDLTLSSSSTIAAYIYETKRSTSVSGAGISIDEENLKGSCEAKINGGTEATISGAGDLGVWAPTIDLSQYMGTDISVELTPIDEAFGCAVVQKWSGFVVQHRVRRYTATSEDTISKKQEAGFVSIGVLSEDAFIDFVGTPRSGTSALAVQFTDLSEVNHAYSTWNFGDGNYATFAGETHPLNTYTTDGCSIDLL